MTESFHSLIPPLPRPQYVAAPEMLLSALAWEMFELDSGPETGGKQLGLIYDGELRGSKGIHFYRTKPSTGEALTDWAEELNAVGVREAGSGRGSKLVAGSVADAIAGVKAKRAKGQAATPLTPKIALLQNVSGMMGVANPPNVAKIIEVMYALGKPQAEDTVAGRWEQATEHRLATDKLLGAIDRAVTEELVPGEIVQVSNQFDDLPRYGYGQNTPFVWFARSWDTLTSADWVDALPARRWVDWATTILRVAVAFGYLWEARWLLHVARHIVSGEGEREFQEVLDPATLLQWVPRSEKVSLRDVTGQLKTNVSRAAEVRDLLRPSLDGNEELSMSESLAALRSDENLVRKLEMALSGTPTNRVNTWEAIRYALLTREHSGPYVDYYGFFDRRGRYLMVEPATEWIVVTASLALRRPDSAGVVSEYLKSLADLGLTPPVAELIDLLEEAGMAIGSPDADQAVEITSAY